MNNLVGIAATSQEQASAVYADWQKIFVLMRDAMRNGGLGKKDSQFPLRDVIDPGMTVLLKPNWVLHYNQSGYGMDCMVTHPAFLMAAITHVAASQPGRIIIGDAPLQGCQWDKLVTPDLANILRHQAPNCPVEIVDFRRTVMRVDSRIEEVKTGIRSEDRYVLFDLAGDSLLEPISKPEGRFRVTMYDPEKLALTHHPGKHQYLLCREAYEADVILNLPKLKTHRKTGITAALKNLVGINGNKDYLPHHRLGGPAHHGDCYPGDEPWKQAVELYFDQANRLIGTAEGEAWRNRALHLLELYKPFFNAEVEGGWHGNDTIWRTVLDLNRALLYGQPNGSLADSPQRLFLSLTDGIIAGQGEGPLAPQPLNLGVVSFSVSAVAADLAHAALLHLDPQRIPLLRGAIQSFRWPLISMDHEVQVIVNDQLLSLDKLARECGVDALPPVGWIGHCELSPQTSSA